MEQFALGIGIQPVKFTAWRVKFHQNFTPYRILVHGRLPKAYAFCGVLLNKTNKGLILLTYKCFFIWTDVGTYALLRDLEENGRAMAINRRQWLLFWRMEVLDGKGTLGKLRRAVPMNQGNVSGAQTQATCGEEKWRSDDWATAVNSWPVKRRHVFKSKTKIKALIVKHMVMVDIKRWNVYINWYCHNNKNV